jgi:hypothetical protein
LKKERIIMATSLKAALKDTSKKTRGRKFGQGNTLGSISPGNILGSVSWKEGLGDKDKIRESLEIEARLRNLVADPKNPGKFKISNTRVGKVKIGKSAPKCKNGTCTQSFEITGLVSRFIVSGSEPSDKTIRVEASALDGRLSSEPVDVILKPTEAGSVKLILRK